MESENQNFVETSQNTDNIVASAMTDDDFFNMLDEFQHENVQRVINQEDALSGAIGENAEAPPPLLRLDFLSAIPAMNDVEIEAYREALRPTVSKYIYM